MGEPCSTHLAGVLLRIRTRRRGPLALGNRPSPGLPPRAPLRGARRRRRPDGLRAIPCGAAVRSPPGSRARTLRRRCRHRTRPCRSSPRRRRPRQCGPGRSGGPRRLGIGLRTLYQPPTAAALASVDVRKGCDDSSAGGTAPPCGGGGAARGAGRGRRPGGPCRHRRGQYRGTARSCAGVGRGAPPRSGPAAPSVWGSGWSDCRRAQALLCWARMLQMAPSCSECSPARHALAHFCASKTANMSKLRGCSGILTAIQP